MKIYLLLCLVTIAVALTTAENPTQKDHQNLQFDEKTIADSIQNFSINFYKEVSNSQKGNFVISPFSANIALNLLAAGAEGGTKDEMLHGLNLPEINQFVKSYYENLINNFMNTKDITIKLLNKVFIGNQFKVKEEFRSLTKDYFHSSEEQLDFYDPENAAKTINSWVSKETNERIKDLINPSSINGETNMIIANVLYFKARWFNEFDVQETFDRDFYTNKGNYQVPMMSEEGFFKNGVLSELKASFIEIPYKNENYTMIIILPDEMNGLEEVDRKLKTMTVKSIRERGVGRNVEIFVPRFKVESTIGMKDALKAMGMRNMFTDLANFSKISDSLNSVSDVVQKIYIEVDEAGTEAGAVTGIKVRSKKTVPEYVLFNADHPFHFKIIKTEGENDGITLFCGNVDSI